MTTKTRKQLRNDLWFPANAVPDTGITMRNGWPVDARREAAERLLEPAAAPLAISVDIFPKAVKDYDRITLAVCRVFNIRLYEVMSDRRNIGVVEARQVAMALCYRLTGRSMTQLGRIFNRDHTTVIHAIQKMRPHLDRIEAHMPPESIMEWVLALKDRLRDPEVAAVLRAKRAKPTCTRGHAFNYTNTIIRLDGSRRCRICAEAGVARYKELLKAKAVSEAKVQMLPVQASGCEQRRGVESPKVAPETIGLRE
jgi:transposase-like protein